MKRREMDRCRDEVKGRKRRKCRRGGDGEKRGRGRERRKIVHAVLGRELQRSW